MVNFSPISLPSQNSENITLENKATSKIGLQLILFYTIQYCKAILKQLYIYASMKHTFFSTKLLQLLT